MKSLLYKLGILKEKGDLFENLLIKLHNDYLSNQIIKQKNLARSHSDKSVCEIKIFFFRIAIPILEQNLSKERFKKAMEVFGDKILFSSINSSVFKNNKLNDILHSRIEFYDELFSDERKKSVLNNYLQNIYDLWYKYPLSNISEITNELKPLNLDGMNMMIAQAEVAEIFRTIIPAYKEALQKIIRQAE